MKRSRENKIIKIIREKNVRTQRELTKYLREVGEEMAQSTLSRDLREIGVIKVPSGEGSCRYELSDEVYSGSSSVGFEFSHFVTEINYSRNLIIIHTTPGNAQGVARSIDMLNLKEVMGAVAGDDTIFVAIGKISNVPKVVKHFEQAVKGLFSKREE